MCLKAETFKTEYEGLWEDVLNTSSQRVHKYLHSVQNFDLHILKQGGGGSMKAWTMITIPTSWRILLWSTYLLSLYLYDFLLTSTAFYFLLTSTGFLFTSTSFYWLLLALHWILLYFYQLSTGFHWFSDTGFLLMFYWHLMDFY